jgi:hypothetical protein
MSLAAAEAAEAEAQRAVERLQAARREAWVAGGGLVDLRATAGENDDEVYDEQFEGADAARCPAAAFMAGGQARRHVDERTDPDPETDPEGWLAHPGAVRRYLAWTHGSLRGILRRFQRGRPGAAGGGDLGSGGGLARVPGFLPAGVARWAAAALAALPEGVWEATGVAGSSRFQSTSNGQGITGQPC